ncbi:MAG: YfcE family phosphodiesterase [Candidatus Thorarchaeota archaeon]
MKVLVFGDTHMPSRTNSIPQEFYLHIERTEYDMALITGDLTNEHEMRKVLPPLPRSFIVRGNMDYSTNQHNFHELVQIQDIKILLLHGTQIKPRGNIKQLWDVGHHIGAEVVVHGHTHQYAVDLYNGRLFLNPGTMSGATGGWSGRMTASFIELDVTKSIIEVKIFTTDWATVKESVSRFEQKDDVIMRVT